MPDNTSNFVKIDCIDNSPIPDSAIYNCRTIYNKYGKLMVYDKLNEEMYKTEYHEGLFYTDKIENRDGSYYYVDKTENKVFHISVDGSDKTQIGKEVTGTIISIASFNRSIVIRTKDNDNIADWIKLSSGEYVIETEDMKKKSSVTKQDLRYLNLYRRAYLATRTYYYGLPVTDSFLTKPKKVYLGDKDPNDYCVYCGGKRSNIVWKGNSANPPFDPKLGWAYFNTTDNKYYMWDGFVWKVKREEDLINKKLHLNLSAPKYKQECVVENEFTTTQSEYDDPDKDYVLLIMPPEAYGMYTFDEFVEVKNKEEFKDIDNELSKYEDNEEAYEIYKQTYIDKNSRYKAGYLQRDYDYKIYIDDNLLEEDVDYYFTKPVNEKDPFNVHIYKSRNIIVPDTLQKIRYESSSKTRYKTCTNPNCYVNAAGLNYAKWQWINDDASIPVLDQVHAGYVSKAGFSLDDYSTETFNYKGSILNLKHRGGGFGFPRSYRFDFEYRFVNREADMKDEPHYFDLYKKILYNTFKRVIYTVMLNHFNVLRYEEIETMLNIIYDLPDDYKCKLVKLTDDFIDIQTRLYEAEEKGDKKTIEKIMDPETGDNKLIVDRLIEIHDELMLPVEYMSIMIVLISYPRHMIILSDSKGGISSKLTVNNSLYSTMDSTNISITHHNGEPITHSVSVEGIVKAVIDRNKENDETDDLYLYENYYLVSDDNFHMSLYSFLNSRWLDNSESKIFDRPFETNAKIVKMKNVKYKGLNCVAIITEKEMALFNFDDNEWVIINDKYTITSQEIFGNDYDLFIDFDYRKYQTVIDVPNGKDKIPTVTTFNYFAFVSTNLFRVYDIDTNKLIECMNYEADPIMPIDIDETTNTNGNDFYLDTTDTKHLADLNKVFINIPSSALVNKDKIKNLIYFTLIDSRGNIQVIKTDGITKVKPFLTIKYVDKISKVINIFDTEDTDVFVVYENMRILSLTSFMYRINILQQPKKITNKTSLIDAKTYITTNNKDIMIMPIVESNPLIETADPPQPIQVIKLQEDLLLPPEYNEINGISYEKDSMLLCVDIKRYGILKMKLIRNTDTTDLNKKMFLIEDIEDVVLEKILVSNRFKYNDGYYLGYITNKDNSASVYAFYEANVDPVGSGIFKSASKLINKGSEVTTYDEVFVKNSNIKMWSRTVYELGVYKQRELFNSQK